MGLFDFFKNSTYRMPHGMTPKERAICLIDDAKEYADDINTSTEVFDFTYAYKHVIACLDELIWLNETKGIWMSPTPRANKSEISNNMRGTINDFISRARSALPHTGPERAEEIERLVHEMESDEVFVGLLSTENRLQIKKLGVEAQEIRNEETLQKIGTQPDLDFSNIDEMQIIRALENRIKILYQESIANGLSVQESDVLFQSFKNACENSALPLVAQIRLEDLLTEYAPKFASESPLWLVDHMEGIDFEFWCAGLLKKLGFSHVEVTPASKDHGVDITAEKDGIHYAIQCKCYHSDLGNTPIQEVHAGKVMYHCQVGVVMTNRRFTAGGIKLAEATGVLLWDRDWLITALEATK